jgi:drug/metabolite transporter (DMT)-like permease
MKNTTIQSNLQNKQLLGILLMIAGLALYPLSDAFIKHLMGIYSVPQATFLRTITRLCPLLIATFFQGGPVKILSTKHPKKHIFRLAISLVYTYCFMYAFSVGSLTTIYTLSYTSAFFMIILSAIILKEKVTLNRWIAVGIGMVGVIIAMRPSASVFEVASIIVLLGTFLGSLNKILMRKLSSTEHSLTIAIYPNIVMLIVTLPLILKSWQKMPFEHWVLFAIVGLIIALGQYLIAQSLKYAQGSVLAPVDYSTFFWVVALDLVWWNTRPDMPTMIGAAIIVGSNLYILYCTKKEEKFRLKKA